MTKLPSSYKTFQADFDNSGTIDYGEFVAAMLHLNKVQREDHLFAAFSYFDKDGSGYITADELQQACEQFGLEDVQLEDIMREVDQDNVNDFPTNFLFYFHYPSHPFAKFLWVQIIFLSDMHSLQDGRIDYSEFVAMMQDTGFGKKGLQNSTSIGFREAFKH